MVNLNRSNHATNDSRGYSMNPQLTSTEIQQIQQILKDEPAQKALTTLEQNNGNLEATFDTLWQEQFGVQEYGKGKSLLQLTLNEIRAEICGDEGLRGKLKEYTKNPGSASLLNSIIGSLVTVAALNGIPIMGRLPQSSRYIF